MGIGYNPKIVKDGLVLYFDAANASKSAKGFKTVNSLSDWSLGTGGTASYFQVGLTSENQRILDTGPFGVSTVVWDNGITDIDSNDDGGFVSSNYTIDPTKLYRFSIWMRRKVIGNGSSYLGCHAWDASTTQHVLNRSNGSTNINPYFLATNYWGNVNEWYLVTGHIWPAGSGTGTSKEESGIYTTTGTKISGTTDYVWQSTNTYTHIRSFLYYSTDTTTNQQLYQPRIDLIDGTEPSIADLISGVGSKLYDLIGSNHGDINNSAALYNSSGYMNFDGVDDRIMINRVSPIGESVNWTIDAWIRYSNVGYTSWMMVTDQTNYTNAQNLMMWLSSDSPTTGKFLATYDGAWQYGTIAMLPNVWYHVCLTRATNTVRFYTNGKFDVQRTYTNTLGTATSNLGIGGHPSNSSYPFNGLISSVKIYNRVLSDFEVQSNFNALRGRFGI